MKVRACDLPRRAVPRDAPTSTASWPVSGPSRANTADRSAVLPLPQIGSSVDMAPGLRELIGLALLAGLGCGAALAHGDLFFVAVFGLAIAMSVVEAMRRFRCSLQKTPRGRMLPT